MTKTPEKITNFIDGQFVASVGGKYLDNIEPATGKPYSQVPDSDTRDVELAVAAAEKAFPDWSRTPAANRSRILLRIADLIERDLEKFARAESIDTGKPLSLARSLDIPRAASNFRFFATAIQHTENEAHVTDGIAFNYTLRQPRGIAGLISPWNLPLYLLSWAAKIRTLSSPMPTGTPPSPAACALPSPIRARSASVVRASSSSARPTKISSTASSRRHLSCVSAIPWKRRPIKARS